MDRGTDEKVADFRGMAGGRGEWEGEGDTYAGDYLSGVCSGGGTPSLRRTGEHPSSGVQKMAGVGRTPLAGMCGREVDFSNRTKFSVGRGKMKKIYTTAEDFAKEFVREATQSKGLWVGGTFEVEEKVVSIKAFNKWVQRVECNGVQDGQDFGTQREMRDWIVRFVQGGKR